jgi:hypothetical protein
MSENESSNTSSSSFAIAIGSGSSNVRFDVPASEEQRDLTRRDIDTVMADHGSALTPVITPADSGSAFVIGTNSRTEPVWINGPVTGDITNTGSQLNDVAIVPLMPPRELPDIGAGISLRQPDDLDRIVPLASDSHISYGDAAIAINPSTAGSTRFIGEDSSSFGQVQSGLPLGNVATAPKTIASITSALDEFADPAGNHHDNVIQNGGKTLDTSPKLLGTLTAELHTGEALVVYRDGVSLGHADVSGLGWSFQDTAVMAGEHVYTARVESTAGVQGVISGDFAIVETAVERFAGFPVLATEDFLIFDTRGISRTTSDGTPLSFDLMECVKSLEKQGLTVKSYTDNDGFISIGVDWLAYAKSHPYEWIDFVSHRHVDNDKGGLNYYDSLGVPDLAYLASSLGTWIETPMVADGAAMQPASPPAATTITGIYDVYPDAPGNPEPSLIPDGGSSASTTHKIVLTFSEPLGRGWVSDSWEIYRDGVRLLPNKDLLDSNYDQATNTGWVIDTNVPPGPHEYTARIQRTYGDQGAWSESYSILETGPAPVAVVTITSALDEFADPSGNHHDNVIQNGSMTADTSPQLHGTISTALQEGEALAIYRDGQQIGTASVTGLGWSFQDNGLATGQHVYTASVISAAGVQGVHSEDFVITETAGTSFNMFPMLGTEDFLIFDTRLIPRVTSDGRPMSFDLLETVKIFEKAGMTVKSYTDNGGLISIEVDWIAYLKTHPNMDMELEIVSHRHVDNASGGLNYYNSIGFPSWDGVLAKLGTWTFAVFSADGAEFQSAKPAPATTITGVYDVYVDADGVEQQSLVPVGGTTASLSHRIEGTISESVQFFSDWLVIYRDGVKLEGSNHSSNFPTTYSNKTWWIIDNDVPPGPHVYTARVERSYGEQGQWSENYGIVETIPPLPIETVATITSALDEFIDPAGNHHDNVIQNGDKTADTSPQLHGTISAALQEGEALAIYRDGQQIGTASVTGVGWSFQDNGLATGQHVYTASVISASGVQGVHSEDFAITETAGTGNSFEIFGTEDFLIFDTRLIPRTLYDGRPASFDLLETVTNFEEAGMTVKSYTDNGGIISIEVDWVAFVKAHPNADPQLVTHSHVDNDKGGLNYYNVISIPTFGYLLEKLGTWTYAGYPSDSPQNHPGTPAPATIIMGIYDVYTDASGNPGQSLVPDGGSTASSTHKIVFTFSEPLDQSLLGDHWEIYRDGVRLLPRDLQESKYDQATNIGSAIDTNVPPGPHVYTMRVPRMFGEQGAWSESYSIVETGPAPVAVATITTALDEFADPAGNHHDTTIQNGGLTSDTSPQLHGTISAALQGGEVLAIYRDGQKIGNASVTGLGWSYQDDGLTTGQHIYTASVISAAGEQSVHSGEFVITETAGTSSGSFQFIATEDFLIFDTRFVPRTTSDGQAVVVDLLEGVRMLEKAGMAVKSYTDNGGMISIEVDWVAYVKAHPDAFFDLPLHRHIASDQGGVDYYNPIAVPDFSILLNLLGKWEPAFFVQDAGGQSPTPAAAATITGVFDSYVDAEGHSQFALVPAGGASGEASHRIEGTLSEPMSKWSDSLVIYRDGVKLTGDTHSFDPLSNDSNATWWVIDNDVPPGPHIYTARVEREFEAPGGWSQSYGILELGHEPTQDSLTARMLMNDTLLVVDTGIVNHTNADGSVASMQLKAELTLAGETVAVFEAAVGDNGIASFEANWARTIAANPNAKLTITAHDNINQSDQIVDIHTIGTLAGQIGHWVTATPYGESAIFFDAADRSTHIHGNAKINTITVSDDHQLIDLTSLTGKTTASTVTGIERIDLGGQHNTLKIAMIDVLNLGETDLFRADGKQQFMVNGKAVDTVELSNTRVAGIADGDWERQGNATIGGVAYDVYEHSTAHVELMVQQGVQLSMH